MGGVAVAFEPRDPSIGRMAKTGEAIKQHLAKRLRFQKSGHDWRGHQAARGQASHLAWSSLSSKATLPITCALHSNESTLSPYKKSADSSTSVAAASPITYTLHSNCPTLFPYKNQQPFICRNRSRHERGQGSELTTTVDNIKFKLLRRASKVVVCQGKHN